MNSFRQWTFPSHLKPTRITLGLLVLFAAFGKPSGQPAGPYAGSVVYFASLGFGFITLELALLQHLTLLVGHPIFTLSVLLFTLLAFGGLGSAMSHRIPARVACVGVAVIGIAEALLLPKVIPSLLAFELPGRVALAMLFAGVPRAERDRRAVDLLGAVGLGDRRRHRPKELSGGEQQRVAIARALANDPRILLADEPTGNLDPQTAGHVFAILVSLVRASGVAALIATHNLELAARMDRIVTLRDGKIVEDVRR